MKKLKNSVADMVAKAKASIVEIDAADAITLASNDNCAIVDVRDVRERHKLGYIPGSFHCPRGMPEFWVDPESPYYNEFFGKDDVTYLFHCASGWRSALTVKTLQDMGFANIAHITEGFSSWQKAGGKISND